ncbi:MAG TPA: proton-conducting transporter membrane subunit [Planctomycetota bacterium]|nr:proton-conducting transporter membrane subunit [Planctomycetota bacterium]
MSPLPLVLAPLGFAAVALAMPSNRWRPVVLPIGALCHLALVIAVLAHGDSTAASGWLSLDPLARLVLLTVALLFTCCALYAPGYLAVRHDRPNRRFCSGLLLQVAMLSLVAMSHHLGLLWVGLEATTLASAPLLYFNQTPRALEAAWKFLLIGSVGIALALLGSFFLAYSELATQQPSSLQFDDLMAAAPQLSKPWLHAAFVTLLVGYGTKMGLAPMHTWKPDAYGEAPGILGAMLAGGLTTGAFLAILRMLALMHAAGEGSFARPILVFMGLLSMVFAAVFMVRQKDIKRMLAYSSVEHMGILALGAGIGGLAMFGALFHMLNNAMTKAVLFLSVGNIHRAFGSKSTDDVTGALGRVPVSAALFLAGFLAITGSPPFGPFVSEFTIARAAFADGQPVAGGLYLALLMAVFLGMGSTVLAVVQGESPSPSSTNSGHVDRPSLTLPIVFALLVVLGLGIWLPGPLRDLLDRASAYVEARP